MRKILLIAVAMMFAWVATAQADVTSLWAPMQLAAGANPPASVLKRFAVVVGTRPLSVPTWRYIKASRSPVSTYPSSWYLTQNGARVRDSKFGFYVMDPRSSGWQQQVAKSCPGNCFLDGAGTTSLGRTTPRLQWTPAQWVAAMVSEIKAVRATGDQVAPNSISLDGMAMLQAAGRGSTESFRGLSSLGLVSAPQPIWVVDHSNCGYNLASFLIGRGSGDLFFCVRLGGNPTSVTAPMSGASIGAPLAPAVKTASGYSRKYQGGLVTANFNGSWHIP